MRFINGNVFCEDGIFREREFCVRDGLFSDSPCKADTADKADIAGNTDKADKKDGKTVDLKDKTVDLKGKTVIPGLIDTHVHGAAGFDFMTGGSDLQGLARLLAAGGVTSFVPTSMTAPPSVLKKVLKNAAEFCDGFYKTKKENAARLLGVHLEGPFISKQKKGAHSEEFIIPPDIDLFKELNAAADGLIKIITLAPEAEGAAAFIAEAKKTCAVSLGHTACGYQTAKGALKAGASRITHLFNAMPPLLHRAPDLIGAAAEDEDAFAELICDGVHVYESAVRAAFKLFKNRIILISDSVAIRDGIRAEGGAAMRGEVIAGSVTPLFNCLKNAVKFGVPLKDAVLAATKNPALSIGVFDKTGSISSGKYADFIVCDAELNLLSVYIGGERVTA